MLTRCRVRCVKHPGSAVFCSPATDHPSWKPLNEAVASTLCHFCTLLKAVLMRGVSTHAALAFRFRAGRVSDFIRGPRRPKRLKELTMAEQGGNTAKCL